MTPWTFPQWLGIALLILGSTITILLGLLAYKFWKICTDMEEDREVATGILKTIKGWTVVNVAKEEIKSEELKKLIEPVPEAAAQKVIDKLEERKQGNGSIHNGGEFPTVK